MTSLSKIEERNQGSMRQTTTRCRVEKLAKHGTIWPQHRHDYNMRSELGELRGSSVSYNKSNKLVERMSVYRFRFIYSVLSLSLSLSLTSASILFYIVSVT